jgi:ubiquitin related modifier 1
MLFSNERKLSLSLPAKDNHGKNTTVAQLIDHLCEEIMKDPRKDLFVLDGSV